MPHTPPRSLFFLGAFVLSAGCGADEGPVGPATGVYLEALPPTPAMRLLAMTVGECLPGAAAEQTATYREGDGELEFRLQEIAFDYDRELAAELELPDDPDELDINFGALPVFFTFRGVAISADEIGEPTAALPAGQVGQWYRQTTRLDYPADLFASTERGPVHLGIVTLTDWDFAVELSLGPDCVPPVPDAFAL